MYIYIHLQIYISTCMSLLYECTGSRLYAWKCMYVYTYVWYEYLCVYVTHTSTYRGLKCMVEGVCAVMFCWLCGCVRSRERRWRLNICTHKCTHKFIRTFARACMHTSTYSCKYIRTRCQRKSPTTRKMIQWAILLIARLVSLSLCLSLSLSLSLFVYVSLSVYLSL